jgi:hypothetical protein
VGPRAPTSIEASLPAVLPERMFPTMLTPPVGTRIPYKLPVIVLALGLGLNTKAPIIAVLGIGEE